ncbi:MAG: ABC transporter ATP-binding protein [Nitrososphaerota archaeon]|nr:ABC transporter ATP-binding protein [Nitrososphaerota archaeon]
MLRMDKVNVFYGGLQALWDVSIEVGENEIVSVIGANGAGKTTTLRVISGLVRLASGSVEIHSKNIAGKDPQKIVEQGISHVPEGRKLFPFMTVRENMLLGAYGGDARRSREETLESVYELFPVLRERSQQIAGTMSGGEQQMLAIGRALMSKPKLLLLDEPSSGLSPLLADKLFDAVKQLNERGTAILLVEQNVYAALDLSDRAYILESGRIVTEGDSKKLVDDEEIRRSYLGA